jgi:hypothetical protein
MVQVRRATPPGTPYRLALVQTVSTNGIGLVLAYPVPPGTMLEIEMQGKTIMKRFARVVHSTRHEDGWLVDCTLNDSMSDGQIDRLLS